MSPVDQVFPATITFSDGTPLARRPISEADGLVFVDYVGAGPGRLRSAHFHVDCREGMPGWSIWTPERLALAIRDAEEFDRRGLAYMQKAGK